MTDIPDVLIENLRQVLSMDDIRPFAELSFKVGTDQAQPMIALWNAAHSVVQVADGKPDATLARLMNQGKPFYCEECGTHND